MIRSLSPLFAALLAPLAIAQEAPSPAPERVTVIAQFLAKPGQASALRTKLLAMIAPTRAEAGCISYDLHVDQANPAQFFFVENWKDEAVLDAHMKTPHFVKLITNGTPALLAAPYTIAKGRILSHFVPKTQTDPRLRSASSLTLVPFFTVKPEKMETVLKAHLAMLAPTHAERGNISYDLFQSRADSNVLFFVENWESMAALKKHMMQPFFVQHVDKEANPGLVVPWTYLTLKRISPPGVGRGARS